MIKTIGIAIPCLNEETYIEKCVRSLMNSDLPKDRFQVVVCDGMSTDNTRQIVIKLCSEFSNLTLLDNPAKITPIAMNIGFDYLQTDAKIILGAHATVANDYLSKNIEFLNQQPEAGCVGGVINNIYENEASKIIGLAMSSPFGVGNARFRTGGKDGFVDTVAFGAYRTSVLEKIGNFDESLIRNQDDEINYRLTSNGYKIFLTNQIQSQYFVRASFQKLYRQYYQYGYWKVYVNKKVKAVTTVRQLFPALLILAIVLGAFLSLFHTFFLITWIFGILSYVVLSIFFAFQKSDKLNEILSIVLAFYTLHFSYGLGYLKGILDFMIMGKQPSNKNSALSR